MTRNQKAERQSQIMGFLLDADWLTKELRDEYKPDSTLWKHYDSLEEKIRKCVEIIQGIQD